jgi:sortase B
VSCLLLVLLGLGGYAGYRLYASHEEYATGDRAYEALAQLVISEETTPEPSAEPSEEPAEVPTAAKDSGEAAEREEQTAASQSPVWVRQFDLPSHTVDFDALRAVSDDAIGWLYCPDTVIDYPVMGAENYTYYLKHLPDGTYNFNGSLFLDYNCQRDFSDRLSVIYGHNMKTEKMFGTLVNYKKQSYFDQHPYLYLYTQEGNYRIALLYGAVVSADTWTGNNFVLDADGLLAYAKANTTFTSTVKYSQEDRLIALSTCSYEYEDARYFVVGVLQPEYLAQ